MEGVLEEKETETWMMMGWPRLDEPFMAESGAGPRGDKVPVGNHVAQIGVSSLTHCWVTLTLCGLVEPVAQGHK